MNEIHYLTQTSSDYQLPVYVTGVGHMDSQEPVYREDGFPDYQWSLAVQGEGELKVGEQIYKVKAGEGFYLPPRVPHTYNTTKWPWEVYWVTFDGHFTDQLARLCGLRAAGAYKLANSGQLKESMTQLLELGRQKQPGLGTHGSKAIYNLLLDLRQQLSEGSATSYQMNERLQPVLKHIDDNSHLPLTLQELADLIQVTPQHLCLLFRKTFQLRPTEYMNRVRVNKGKEKLLQQSSIKIHELARELGFDNTGYFNVVFKRHAGMTPGEFRRRSGSI